MKKNDLYNAITKAYEDLYKEKIAKLPNKTPFIIEKLTGFASSIYQHINADFYELNENIQYSLSENIWGDLIKSYEIIDLFSYLHYNSLITSEFSSYEITIQNNGEFLNNLTNVIKEIVFDSCYHLVSGFVYSLESILKLYILNELDLLANLNIDFNKLIKDLPVINLSDLNWEEDIQEYLLNTYGL